jgi:hypothetical protein
MKIVPCTRDHVPEVVGLLLDGGQGTDPAQRSTLSGYVEEVYFDNPWYDPELPSLVCEDASGRIDGFLGVIPRPMVGPEGRPVRAAATSNFKVRGASPGDARPRNPLAAVRLLKTFFGGPQDLSVANGANPSSKRIWEACGGYSVPLCSLDWFRSIRPARALLELAVQQRTRPLPRGMRQLADLADLTAGRPLARRYVTDGQAAGCSLRELDAETAAQGLAQAPGFDLRPAYEAPGFRWLLEMSRRKAVGGVLRGVAVRDEARQRDIGWFVYYQKKPRVAEVLQLVALDGRLDAVLGAAIRDAADQRMALLRGDVDARDLQAYRDAVCLLNTGRWMLVHAREPAVFEAFQRGRALFSALDGERWIMEIGREMM